MASATSNRTVFDGRTLALIVASALEEKHCVRIRAKGATQ
jgi:hypothetical protein